MESVSRPPHRRKHSAAATAFAVTGKNPYDDVFLSRGGKGRALEAHEYTEIFSGSPTSIPVLDLSALEERAESGGGQVSAIDYANIFGGLRNDDVAAPYEEVFGGSAKKDKPRIPADSKQSLPQSNSLQTRKSSKIPADSQPSLRQSGSLHKRKSSETPNHFIPGAEQQFNVSFNKTHQRDSDASTGKTHIAQLHSVPGFTFFVNETPRQLDTEYLKPVPPLKRDVSRSWSFSGEVKDVKGKHGVSLDKSCVPDMELNRNETDVKLVHLKVPPSSIHPPNPCNSKDPRCVRTSKFASKESAPKKDDGEYSPPFLDEEFDENSVAAASAATLKKAIEQAQESIRLAKLIMERKRAGHEDRSKSGLRGRLKNSSKKTEIEHEVSGFKETLSREHEKLHTKFMGVDGKGGRSLSQKDIHFNDGNVGLETAQKKVKGAEDNGEEFICEDGLFTLSFSQLGRNSQLNGNEESIVEAPKVHGEATQCRTATLGSVTLGNNDGFIPTVGKVGPDHTRVETGKEAFKQRDVSVGVPGHEVLSERDLNRSPRMRDMEESTVESELRQVYFDRAKGPEVLVEPLERVLSTSQIPLKVEKVMDEDDENLRIGLEEIVFEERENDPNVMVKNGKKFEQHEEVLNVANFAEPESVVIDFLKESWNLMGNEVQEQDKIKRYPSDASDFKESEHNNRGKYDEGEKEMTWKEEFEYKMHQEEEFTVREPTAHQAMSDFEKTVETLELEVDQRPRHHNTDELNFHEEFEEEIIEEKHQESQFMQTGNESFWDMEETTDTLRETRRTEENHNEKRHENSSGYEAHENHDPEACNVAEAQKHDAVWDVEEISISLRGSGGSEEDHNEEIHEDTSGHFKDDISIEPHNEEILEDTSGHGKDDIGIEPSSFVEVEPVWDVRETNNTMRTAGRGEDNNEVRHAKTSEHEANDSLVGETGSFPEIQENDLFWHVDETSSSLKTMGMSEGHHNDERHNVPSEHEADKSQVMEENKFAEVCKNEPFWDVEKTNSTLKETGRSEDHNVFEFQETASYVRTDETVDANNGGVDLKNAAEIYQRTFESSTESDTVPASMGSQSYKGVEADKPFPMEDNEIPGIESLRQIASGEDFIRCQQNKATDDLLSGNKTENIGVADSFSKDSSSEKEYAFKADSEIHGTTQYDADSNSSDAISSDNRSEEYDVTDESQVLEHTSESDNGSESTCSPDDVDRLLSHGFERCAESVKDAAPSKVEIVDDPKASTEKKCSEQSEGLFPQSQSKPKEKKGFTEAKRTEGTSSNIENSEDPIETGKSVEKDSKEDVQDIEKLELQQRIEAIKRAREREKERQVVERAIREARERAFAEARERAGKAAADKAAAEVQQKVTSEAQQKLEKPPAVKQPDKVSTDAKLRAERAAVEKVLAEARGRALEKALSQKTSAETKTVADRNKGLKQSFSSSDLENSTAPESAQRRKARLERHQRIMERAAKALAEKNMRDILAQKEQAERNRLAESLDADIKRWATGKEGNLRALLSTLQYILGRDSGWQAIPLTEILTPAAVKKAYRKATLYVHPDKLQQRGASIRQKYICEKVFDLLKAAWNKFNSEER